MFMIDMFITLFARSKGQDNNLELKYLAAAGWEISEGNIILI